MKKFTFFLYIFVAMLLTFGITIHMTTAHILDHVDKKIDNIKNDYIQKYGVYEKDIPTPTVVEDLYTLRKKIHLSQDIYKRYEWMLLCVITNVTLLLAHPISNYRRNKAIKIKNEK